MHRIPKIFWLVIPGVVFIVVLIIFLNILPNTQSSHTAEPGLAPTPQPTTIVPTPVTLSPADLLVTKLTDYQVEDPKLTAPNFDQHIFLPEAQ